MRTIFLGYGTSKGKTFDKLKQGDVMKDKSICLNTLFVQFLFNLDKIKKSKPLTNNHSKDFMCIHDSNILKLYSEPWIKWRGENIVHNQQFGNHGKH